jgi:hypothetical protein
MKHSPSLVVSVVESTVDARLLCGLSVVWYQFLLDEALTVCDNGSRRVNYPFISSVWIEN